MKLTGASGVGYPSGNISAVADPGSIGGGSMAVDGASTRPSAFEALIMQQMQAAHDAARRREVAGAVAGNPAYPSSKLEEMVRMRMRSQPASYFDHWHMHKVGSETVVVLVIHKGAPIVLTDEWPLFPSDALITKLRLLENER